MMDSVLPAKIDRQTTTPFLLRLFYKTGSFNRLDEFTPTSLPPHVCIYTWQSCTLSELTSLLTTALPGLLPDPAIGTRLAFKLVFPDTRPANSSSGIGRYVMKELGSVIIGEGGPGVEEESSLGGEPDKTLQEARFVIGDYIACAVLPPLANGAVAPLPATSGPGAGFGGRRGDFGGDFGPGRGRENGFSGPPGFRGRGGRGGPYGARENGFGNGGLPDGEWRRGERLPEGPPLMGRGRGYGGGGGGGRGRW